MRWDAAAYRESFDFVTGYGGDVLQVLLDCLQDGCRVIDVGCGTGDHAAALAERGFEVLGVDLDADMLALAAQRFPGVPFVAADVQRLRPTDVGIFDAAFSNAALHWMVDQQAALSAIREVLRPGAPFVAEMGGRGNVAVADAAIVAAAGRVGLADAPIVKYFPSSAEQASRLEAAGFRVDALWWFERPTLLRHGQSLADWSRIFRASVWESVPAAQHAEFAAAIDECGASLQTQQGWFIDYCRLRFRATAVESSSAR